MLHISSDQLFSMALQHHQSGRLAEAEHLYRQILAQHPGHVDSWVNLGALFQAQGNLDPAIAAYRKALELSAGNAVSHNNLGSALQARHDRDSAIVAYRQALHLDPDYADAHMNLANLLLDTGQLDAAIDHARRVTQLRPDSAEAFFLLATAWSAKGNTDAAIAAYRDTIRLDPAHAAAYNDLAIALKDSGQIDAALVCHRQALQLAPQNAGIHSNLIFTQLFDAHADLDAQCQELRSWNRSFAVPLRGSIGPHPNDPTPDRRLRIGYVSADFWHHASECFLLPLFRHHEQVELVCYAETHRHDDAATQFQQLVPLWRNTAGISDQHVAEMIRADRIDILVDLKLHTGHNRLPVFALKPAPVQATWLGYPGSTGLQTMDYRLTDPYLDPPPTAASPPPPPTRQDGGFVECPLRLPDTFWCYDPLVHQPLVNPLPAQTRGSITFGCLNNCCKINSGVLTLWAQVLRARANSRLLLLVPEGSARARITSQLASAGVAPHRVQFHARLPHQHYLELYHEIDIGLDTLPYNGHTTSLDSFWMGVPVITLIGKTVVGRAGFSQLMNLGLPEFAANSPEEFVAIASTLAADLPRLASLRATLRTRMEQSPLMDAPRFARHMEAAFRQMWSKWCARPGNPA